MKSIFMITALASMSLVGCSHGPRGHHHLSKIVNGHHRSQKNIDRNHYRHPTKTLSFFEVKPHMAVAEISPGGGWYTEILGPFLKKKGQYYITKFPNEGRPYYPKLNKMVQQKISDKNLYGKVQSVTFLPGHTMEQIAPENSLDRVLSFRNLHNWMKAGKAKEAIEAFYKILKPGGILGVVDHRAKLTSKIDEKAISGYVREDYAIELIKSAGFEFVAKSEINANYLDSSEHSAGVWNLPPSLRNVEEDKLSYYQAIGESDRFTLKFRKPLK